MTRPERLPGPRLSEPDELLPREAYGGISAVKCVIMFDGTVSGCVVLKSLGSKADEVVIHWLSLQRYKPATCDGRPVSVRYVFNFRFRTPSTPVRGS
jgi:hypothetical protein